MAVIEERAPAKVNLDLCITGRRQDGYHELDSIVAFADVADTLRITPADSLSLEVEGTFARHLSGGDGDNLVLRAARILADASGCHAGAALHLDKQLPVAAGLGGGSADAAAALRGLCRLWGLSLTRDEMVCLAAKIGADVPACLAGQPLRMRGIGELIEPLDDVPQLHLLLVNPRATLPTPAVFAVYARQPPARVTLGPLRWRSLDDLAASRNDLEAAALELRPVIADVLAALGALPGCRFARMSGSGATCFAVFDDAAQRNAARRTLADTNPDWWVQA